MLFFITISKTVDDKGIHKNQESLYKSIIDGGLFEKRFRKLQVINGQFMIENIEEEGAFKKNIKEFSKMKSIDDVTSRNMSVTSKTKS